MGQVNATHWRPRSNVLGRDLNEARCFEHCFWEHQRKLFSGRGYDPRDQDVVLRPMGSLIEKPFNLSVKKVLVRDRNLTPDRDVLMKGRCQYHFLGMGRPNQGSWKGLIYVGQQLLRRNENQEACLMDNRIDWLCCMNEGKRFVWILRHRAGKGGVESSLRKAARPGHGSGRTHVDI